MLTFYIYKENILYQKRQTSFGNQVLFQGFKNVSKKYFLKNLFHKPSKKYHQSPKSSRKHKIKHAEI